MNRTSLKKTIKPRKKELARKKYEQECWTKKLVSLYFMFILYVNILYVKCIKHEK